MPKTPFNPDDPEYRNKPAFLSQMQLFINLCEKGHHAKRCGQGACSMNCAVSIEYEIVFPPPVSDAANGNHITLETFLHSHLAVNFHLVVNYKERTDGVSAACLQYDPKYAQLGPLQDEIKSLLDKIKNTRTYLVESPGSPSNTAFFEQEPPPPVTNGERTRLRNVDSGMISGVDIRLAGNQADNQNILMCQMRSVCENAGATITDSFEMTGYDFSIARMSISGRYAGTQFRVSIHGISENVTISDEFSIHWEEPKYARQMLSPGIKLLVDALDIMIASIKYSHIFQR
jgi:hypothetical protein